MRLTRKAILMILLLTPVVVRAGDINKDLLVAATKGDTAAVQALLDAGADVNAKTPNGMTALMAAQENDQVIEILKNAGAKQ